MRVFLLLRVKSHIKTRAAWRGRVIFPGRHGTKHLLRAQLMLINISPRPASRQDEPESTPAELRLSSALLDQSQAAASKGGVA